VNHKEGVGYCNYCGKEVRDSFRLGDGFCECSFRRTDQKPTNEENLVQEFRLSYGEGKYAKKDYNLFVAGYHAGERARFTTLKEEIAKLQAREIEMAKWHEDRIKARENGISKLHGEITTLKNSLAEAEKARDSEHTCSLEDQQAREEAESKSKGLELRVEILSRGLKSMTDDYSHHCYEHAPDGDCLVCAALGMVKE